MSLPTPLRALAASRPDHARAVIRAALDRARGHRGRAADSLARGAKPLLPAGGTTQGRYYLLWKTIVALGMGDEVRARWPAPSDPRGRPPAP